MWFTTAPWSVFTHLTNIHANSLKERLKVFLGTLRVRWESWIIEKVLKFAQTFWKSLENRDKVFKKWWKLLSLKVTISALQVNFFFRAGQIWSNLACMFAARYGKSFVPSFFKGLYWSPIWYPWVWKQKLLFWKKSWILDPNICLNSVH